MNYFDFEDNKSEFTFSAPHSSNIYPNGSTSKEPGDRGTKELTLKIHELLECNYLVSSVSRTYVDFNRDSDNCVINSFGGKKFNENLAKGELNKRLSIHNKYFNILKSMLSKFHISIHSMNEIGGLGSPDVGMNRSQIVISNLDGKSCSNELLNQLCIEFESKGFSVNLNQPFKGGFEIKYSSKFCKSIQLEIRKDMLLSLNENLFIDQEKVDKMANAISDIVRKVLR